MTMVQQIARGLGTNSCNKFKSNICLTLKRIITQSLRTLFDKFNGQNDDVTFACYVCTWRPTVIPKLSSMCELSIVFRLEETFFMLINRYF